MLSKVILEFELRRIALPSSKLIIAFPSPKISISFPSNKSVLASARFQSSESFLYSTAPSTYDKVAPILALGFVLK